MRFVSRNAKSHRGELLNTPEAAEVWAAELAQRFQGRTLANYRKAFSPSGAKGVPADADLILDLLIKHPDRLRRMLPDTVETRSLQLLAQERRKLVDRQTSESLRTDLLSRAR